MIKMNSKTMIDAGSPVVFIKGINKNLLGAGAGSATSFSGLTSMLSQVQSVFGGALGMGGILGQFSALSGAFGSLTSLTSAFGSISSLSGALSSFTSVGSMLGGLTGGGGLLSSLSGSLTGAMGSLGSLSGLSGMLGSLSGSSLFSSISSSLTNLSGAGGGGSSMNNVSQTYHAIEQLDSSLNTATILAAYGVQRSQPGSDATIEELQALMEDIHNILTNEGESAISDLETGVNDVHEMIDELVPDIEVVTSEFELL